MLKEKHVHTTDAQFEAIWSVLGKSKDGTKSISVPRDALLSVMMDHANLYSQAFPNVPSPQKVARRTR